MKDYSDRRSASKPSRPPAILTGFFGFKQYAKLDPDAEDIGLNSENTLFYQLIAAERHVRHQRAYRRLWLLGHWTGVCCGWLILFAVLMLMFVTIDHFDNSDYRTWRDYRVGTTYVDATSAAEVEVIGTRLFTEGYADYAEAMMQVTIPYEQMEKLLDYATESGRTLVVRYERPDGILSVIKLDSDDMQACVLDSFYHYEPKAYTYHATEIYRTGFWYLYHAWVCRFYQNFTLLMHVRTGFGAFCSAILLLAIIFFVTNCLDKVRLSYLREHKKYCGEFEEDAELHRKPRKTETEDNDNEAEMETEAGTD